VAASTNEFGATLRSWRGRAGPEEFGLPITAHRRVRGLRRQELARMAGVSPDYLIQLEQGRASTPSPQVLTGLARALRLTAAERAHLFRLADRLVPDEKRNRVTLPGSIRRLVERLSASPAIICDAGWNPMAWNAMWAATVGDPLQRPERERNIVWRHFAGLPTRVARTRVEQREFEEAVVADLRSSYGRYPEDKGFAQLIADLRNASPRFCSHWEERRVGVYEQEHKTIEHPELGVLQVDCAILTTHRNDLRVVVYTAAPGTPSAKALLELSDACAHNRPLIDLPREDEAQRGPAGTNQLNHQVPRRLSPAAPDM